MTKPENIPQWAWEKAESALDTMLANHGYEGWRADSISTISKALLSAVEEEREACALAAYSTPHYTIGIGAGDLDELGQLKPGSPYDAGRYDAAKAIRSRKEA